MSNLHSPTFEIEKQPLILLFQGAAGKYQIAQEKTQLELDKSHQEIDILREKMERNTGESRRVSFISCAHSSDIWWTNALE